MKRNSRTAARGPLTLGLAAALMTGASGTAWAQTGWTGT